MSIPGPVYLHGCPAVDATVVVFVPLGQNQQKPFPNWYGAPALRAVKFCGVKVFI